MPTPPINFAHLTVASCPWTFNWEGGTEHWRYAAFSSAVENQFKRAIVERIEALGVDVRVTSLHGITGTSYPSAVNDKSMTSPGATKRWRQMQDLVNALSPFYVDAYSSGSRVDFTAASAFAIALTAISGSNPIITPATGVGYPTMATPWDFTDSPSAHFRRYKPREITSLTAAGTEGWIARLLRTSSTDTAGYAYGSLYKYTSGSWVLFTPSDPTLYKADVLAQTNGLIQTGDYFGPWILNDLRDQINRLVVVKAVNNGSGGYPSNALIEWTSKGEMESQQNSGSDGVADGTWGTDSSFAESSGPGAVTKLESGSGFVSASAAYSYPSASFDGHIPSSDNFPPDDPVNAPMNIPSYGPMEDRYKRVHFFWGVDHVNHSTGVTDYVYDAQGFGPTTDNTLNYLSTVSGTDAILYGAKVGSTNVPPDTVADKTAGFLPSVDVLFVTLFALIDWGQSGGFEYTAEHDGPTSGF